ncbi:MAG: hypothetical protein JWQ71_3609 [Pedosphaera sp.]|nr:hypothetical protein [Pedosphaera sp.]
MMKGTRVLISGFKEAALRRRAYFAIGCLLTTFCIGKLVPNASAVPGPTGTAGLTNPIVFVTQVPIPRENNGNVSNTFCSVVTLFGNQTSDTARAGRGGDLWLLYTNGTLLNLTRAAGFGVSGAQHTNGIAVRDPHIHWGGGKVLFSMVVGAPRFSGDTNVFFWQLYELTNLASVVANSNVVPAFVKVPNQPTNYNNVSPCYATDGRIIFMSDRPFKDQAHLYPQLEEYKGAPSVSGTYSLDPTTNDLRVIEHVPSGAFGPFVDSFGRLILTRWDHLVVDSNSTDDRLSRATNGALNFSTEAPSASILTNLVETFPEPRNFDTNTLNTLNINGNTFNQFFPWMMSQDGGNEELLNHVGRQELNRSINTSFRADQDLVALTNNTAAARAGAGIVSANTNYLDNFFQIAEDPRQPGTYFGVDAPDFSPNGGTHTAGQIITLTGPPSLNPTGMVVSYITPKISNPATAGGVFRNPLPMTDGALVAAYAAVTALDSNLGTDSNIIPAYHFRLMTLTKSGATWVTNKSVTTGISANTLYWDGTTLVTNNNTLWELQPVEVVSRHVPTPWNPGVANIEAQVFSEENVDMPTFQADLKARNLALVISRNVTARDAGDKQQPFNLGVPGGTNSLVPGYHTNYDITHLQFLQADYLRGYNLGTTNITSGRRVLATPMHDTASFNPPSSRPNAPLGGTELMSDGSQATIVPAGRAVTWQLTGTNNNLSIVKERYWITFRPGEVRTCANCHGINDKDQLGRSAPANPPLALRQLLRYWRTNGASSYQLTVNQGSGNGTYGAGSILSLTANPPASGQAFAQWIGSGVSNPTALTTSFTMPGSNTIISATYTNLPAPQITSINQTNGNGPIQLSVQGLASRAYVIQTSDDLLLWSNLATNTADSNGLLLYSTPVNAAIPKRFFRITYP